MLSTGNKYIKVNKVFTYFASRFLAAGDVEVWGKGTDEEGNIATVTKKVKVSKIEIILSHLLF